MPLHIALLRAVNVGGTGKLPMADLRALASALGFGEPRTLLASGNLVFEAPADPDPGPLLQAALDSRLGLKSDVIMRSPRAWAEMIVANPFPALAGERPSALLAMPLTAPPADGAVEALRAAIPGPEQVELAGDNLFVAYLDGMGTSKLTNTLIERKLGVRGTGRNWNTVLKLAALTGSVP